MKCSLGISNFLEEISSLSHSVVLLYFFAFIAEEGFLISSCYSLELCIQILYLSFSPLLFTSLLFTAICKASPDSHFAFFAFLFYGKEQKEGIFSWTKRLARQVVQRILNTVLWPSPITAHWVACQQNLCQTWEWTFSAPWNKMVMKCPPKIMVKFMSKKGLCQLKTDTCPLYLQRLNHGCCNCWVSMPLKVVQGENQEWGTLCSGKNWQNRSSHS